MEQYLTMITLGVADLQRSVAFYEGLGWERSAMSTGDMVLFELGQLKLSLYPIVELAKDVTLEHQPSRFSGITLAHNVGSEQEVDRVMEQAQAVGAKIVKPAQKVFWGGYSGYFADPDGYIFEIAYNPFWK